MLSKNQRISRKTVNYLLKKGLKFNHQYFQAKYCLNKYHLNRYSVVISKKVLKLATDRNHLRRQIYEAIQKIDTISQLNHFDAIITVKSSPNNLTFTALTKLLTPILQQISIQINLNHGQQSSQKSAQ